nr:uncharacterized protein LOC121115982 [Lepeophtheirus salmonis]
MSLQSILLRSSLFFLLISISDISCQDRDTSSRALSAPYPYAGRSPVQSVSESNEDDFDNEDEKAFFDLLNKLLWNSDDEEGTGRSLLRSRGLFNRRMPRILKSGKSLPGQMYRSISKQCYGLACRLGFSRLARSLNDILG